MSKFYKSDLEYVLAKSPEKRTQADLDFLEMHARHIAARAQTDRIKGVTDPQLAGLVASFVNPQPDETPEEYQERFLKGVLSDEG